MASSHSQVLPFSPDTASAFRQWGGLLLIGVPRFQRGLQPSNLPPNIPHPDQCRLLIDKWTCLVCWSGFGLLDESKEVW